eukprot:XP_011677614.1 PREDICTED: pre-mRNA-splicing factor 38A [Strongylocentrotus purpuratus]
MANRDGPGGPSQRTREKPQYLVEKITKIKKIMNQDTEGRSGALRYVRCLGALYIRLVGEGLDVYKYLEPLYNDYRKIRRQDKIGGYFLSHVDEFIDELLNEERVCDIILPRVQKRHILEETEQLELRVSPLEEDLDDMEDSSDDDIDIPEIKKSPERHRGSYHDHDRPRRSPSPRHRRSRSRSPKRRSRSPKRRSPSPRRDRERRRSRSPRRERERRSRSRERRHRSPVRNYHRDERRDERRDDRRDERSDDRYHHRHRSTSPDDRHRRSYRK